MVVYLLAHGMYAHQQALNLDKLRYNVMEKLRKYECEWRGYKGISKIDYRKFINHKVNQLLNEKQRINDYYTAEYQLKSFLASDIYGCDHVRYFAAFVVEDLIRATHDPVRLMRLYGGNADLIAEYLLEE